MVSNNITKWLRAKRRNGIILSSLYAAAALVGGIIALGLTYCVAFLGFKIFLLVLTPAEYLATIISLFLSVFLIGFLWEDSKSASRYDSLVIEGWILREFLEVGPRAVRDGLGAVRRVWHLAALDVDLCAGILAMLAAHNRSVARADLEKLFPGLQWKTLIPQLRELEGMLFLGPRVSRLGLVAPLRVELYQLWVADRIEEESPTPEPEPEPQAEPEAQPESTDQAHQYTPEELLGVAPSASVAQIKAAYRRRMKECHPDRFAGGDERSRELAEEWTKAINAAYETLMVGRREARK